MGVEYIYTINSVWYSDKALLSRHVPYRFSVQSPETFIFIQLYHVPPHKIPPLFIYSLYSIAIPHLHLILIERHHTNYFNILDSPSRTYSPTNQVIVSNSTCCSRRSTINYCIGTNATAPNHCNLATAALSSEYSEYNSSRWTVV